MSESNPESPPSSPPKPASARKVYEPPRIVSREPLEAVAAVCSPAPPAKGNPGLCPQGPISS